MSDGAERTEARSEKKLTTEFAEGAAAEGTEFVVSVVGRGARAPRPFPLRRRDGIFVEAAGELGI